MTQPTPISTADKVRKPLDVSTLMALGVFLLVTTALAISVWTGDGAVTSDLSKNFIGPGFLIIIGYYFGSSSSSRRKDETIDSQAATIEKDAGK